MIEQSASRKLWEHGHLRTAYMHCRQAHLDQTAMKLMMRMQRLMLGGAVQADNVLLEHPLRSTRRPKIKLADFGHARATGPWTAEQAEQQGIGFR